jgi:tetratricopeptide (TPR) repeat protein
MIDADGLRWGGRGSVKTGCARRGHGRPRASAGLGVLLTFALAGGAARAAEVADAEKLFKSGKYVECIDACGKAIEAGELGDAWWTLKARAELTVGRYPDALKTYQDGMARYDGSLPLRLIGVQARRMNDQPEGARRSLDAIRVVYEQTPWRFEDTANRVALGRAYLILGADARQVLEQLYDRAKKASPTDPAPLLASGDLALEKNDNAVAGDAFTAAAKLDPDDPDAYFGIARAFEDNPEQANAALAKALELNPRHVESLLFQADNLIDREAYPQVEELLKKVLEINPRHPKALALRAVVAHLTGDRKAEAAFRDQALAPWSTNPEVDFTIGLKLSQHYRFPDGYGYQQKALAFDPGYRPAKMQMSQDLLRLGKEDEGWRLAEEVAREDPYNVWAYNLVTLHNTIRKYSTLRDDHFTVRMDAHEAQIYGPRVQRLLARARDVLTKKYDVRLPEQTTIEIFSQQKDFAIRTFGLPGGEGFLGVCFGPVVTMTSAATRGGHESNWEAILWHEFCHTITLTKTKNKMPRWLSEGISVYEERKENATWGQVMTPAYRELILAGGATPVSKLTSAFMQPPSPAHLQFAYFESSMVVEYIHQKYGPDAINKILADLGADVAINAALAKNTVPIDQLDAEFAAWLKGQAEGLAAKADLTRPKLPPDADSATVAAWVKDHPNNYWGLLALGQALLTERKFAEARAPLEQALALFPNYAEGGGPYVLLAAANREAGDARREREVLEQYTRLNADDVDPRLRLAALAATADDWKAVRAQAEQLLAIDPLVTAPYEWLAQAATKLGDRPAAIEAHRTLLRLDTLDRSEHHYQLAKLLSEEKDLAQARREVVLSLEDAPRYRDAHKLLLDIVGKMGDGATTQPSTAPATRPAMILTPPGPSPALAPSAPGAGR